MRQAKAWEPVLNMASPKNESDEPRFVKIDEVRRLTSLSKAGLYKLIRKGEFPKPISIMAPPVAWIEHEVRAWQAERIADSRREVGA